MTEHARQVVYQYPTGHAGTWDFAVWTIGTDRFVIHYADGTEPEKITLNGTARAYADTAASGYGQVVRAVEG